VFSVGETVTDPEVAPPIATDWLTPCASVNAIWQLVALVEDQVKVVLPPRMIEAGFAWNVAVGSGPGGTTGAV